MRHHINEVAIGALAYEFSVSKDDSIFGDARYLDGWMTLDMVKDCIRYFPDAVYDKASQFPLFRLREKGFHHNDAFTRTAVRMEVYCTIQRELPEILRFARGPMAVGKEDFRKLVSSIVGNNTRAMVCVTSEGVLFSGYFNTVTGRLDYSKNSPKVHVVGSYREIDAIKTTEEYLLWGASLEERADEVNRWVQKKFHRAFWERLKDEDEEY